MHNPEGILTLRKIRASNNIQVLNTWVNVLKCTVCISVAINPFRRNLSIFCLILGGWPPNAAGGGQFRPQYPQQGGPQQWAQGPRPGPPQGPPNQWDQNRYPVNQQYGPVSFNFRALNFIFLYTIFSF